jgi:hypothetical protein
MTKKTGKLFMKLEHMLNGLLMKNGVMFRHTAENANAFAGTFAFLPRLVPTQKKQKSLQATARGHCKLDTTDLLIKRTTTHNSTYKKLAVQWLNEALCFVSSSVLADSFRLRNRQLLVAAKRWAQSLLNPESSDFHS